MRFFVNKGLYASGLVTRCHQHIVDLLLECSHHAICPIRGWFVCGDATSELQCVFVHQEEIAELTANVMHEHVDVPLQRQMVLQQDARRMAVYHICSRAEKILPCPAHTLVQAKAVVAQPKLVDEAELAAAQPLHAVLVCQFENIIVGGQHTAATNFVVEQQRLAVDHNVILEYHHVGMLCQRSQPTPQQNVVICNAHTLVVDKVGTPRGGVCE